MIRQSERDAVLQRVDRQIVDFAEYNCPIALECEHIPVDRFERVDQRRVALKHIAYWSGVLSFQSILIVLPPLVR